MAKLGRVVGALLLVMLAGCGDDGEEAGGNAPVPARCADFNALRNVYFGDLHVHTAYSYDAYAFGVWTNPDDAYRFARGEPLALPPLEPDGSGARQIRLDRPLDFVAVADHSEFLAETEVCSMPGLPGYDSPTCARFRLGGTPGYQALGAPLSRENPRRSQDICGDDGTPCLSRALTVWERIVEAANAANDSAPQCRFTALVAYEYSGSTGGSTRHRNVIFRGDRVPPPISYFEAEAPLDLWRQLDQQCRKADPACDVLAIPHNTNESNGNVFFVEYPGAASVEEEREQAALRADMEPLVEIYQHKGDSECMNGLSGILGAPDELCEFEKRPRDPFTDCLDERGALGAVNWGCYSRLDFVRGALLEGLKEKARIGVNPYRLGVIAGTDTHNSAAGFTREDQFGGHHGTVDGTAEKRLTTVNLLDYSPGGLSAVWATENTRAAIFDALKRRETFGTSGPRISVRFFGGWGYDPGLCESADLTEVGYARGVPMGGVLPPGAGAPRFVVSALRDPGSDALPGTPLQRIQIVKGWIEDGEAHQHVYDVAGDPNNGASVDLDTCVPVGAGFDSLCTVWTDPDFEPSRETFYYARVVENPTCRWSSYDCGGLEPEARPASCQRAAATVQERAWTSPIWYSPSAG